MGRRSPRVVSRVGLAYGLNFAELMVAATMPCSAARAWTPSERAISGEGPGGKGQD